VAAHYGSRATGGLIDGWLVDESDADCVGDIRERGIACRAVPLFMTDLDRTAQMAEEALDLAAQVTSTP